MFFVFCMIYVGKFYFPVTGQHFIAHCTVYCCMRPKKQE